MYTHSRSAENPEAAHRKLPIGWSEDGITEYNRIYDAVEIDRKSNGIQFGHELFKIFEARVNGKKRFKHSDGPKPKQMRIVARNDMERVDPSQIPDPLETQHDENDAFPSTALFV